MLQSSYGQAIESAIGELQFPMNPFELYEPIRYTLALGGKRLRPQLVLMACDLFAGKFDQAIHPALGVEVFHNFTLLHDDIMDEAPLRRGKATVHTKWNSNIAILSGDVMFVEACRLISAAPDHCLRDVLAVFYQTAIEVCEGQQFDMNFEDRSDVSLEEYLDMIRLKTAVLLGGGLQIGALCGGADAQDAHLLYDFGCHLGVAFQLMDDVLDVYGDPEKFGKQVGGDILANKKTFLSLRAFEKASGDVMDELTQAYSTRENSLDKIKLVTRIFEELEVRSDAEAEMERHYLAALQALGELHIPQSKKEPLYTFAARLMQRER